MTGYESKRAAAQDKLVVTDIDGHVVRDARKPKKAQPAQEPAAMRMPKVGDRVVCIEDESLATVQSLTAGGSPDIKFDDGSYGTYLLREFAELFRYSSTPQRPWVGLTEEDFSAINQSCFTKLQAAASAESILKEKNNG